MPHSPSNIHYIQYVFIYIYSAYSGYISATGAAGVTTPYKYGEKVWAVYAMRERKMRVDGAKADNFSSQIYIYHMHYLDMPKQFSCMYKYIDTYISYILTLD